MKYRFIRVHRTQFSIQRMCRVLSASRSGYYAWLKRPISQRAIHHAHLLVRIRSAHQQSRNRYGSPKVHAILHSQGELVSVSTVARIMHKHGIVSKISRKYKVTTQSKRTPPPAPNRLRQQFTITRPNRCWVSDVTAIATRTGWLYLATVMELYSRMIIGWSMAARNTTQLITQALQMAIARRQPKPGLLVHSDQGVQYAAKPYQALLNEHGMVCSMSRRGNCYDNAVMESFYHSLKAELIMFEDYRTHAQARGSIFEYIEVFYNRQRIHSSLAYQTPYDYDVAATAT